MNMKKILFFAATATMLFAACTNEDLVAPQTGAETALEDGAVGFDVYVPGATAQTRAGLEGTMTTNRLQRSERYGGGFGVYAYLVEDKNDASAATTYATWQGTTPEKAPNFMVNEKLLWNSVNQGWFYNPLKYWPNETNKDSQTTPAEMQGQPTSPKQHLDRLTFFAYAPYVSAGANEPGITALTDNTGKLGGSGDVVEATIGYKASLNDPNEAVDLLWGVAPAGGLTYTAVNGEVVNVNEGMPLVDMTKPSVNTNMKFLFQHALARINVNVVAAIDQIGAGGTLDPNTKITIDEITLTGYFGETGNLNLDNTAANVANWRSINGVDLAAGTTLNDLTKKTLTLSTTNETIAKHLRFVGTHDTPEEQVNRIGVTTIRQSVIEPSISGDKTNGTNGPWVTSKKYDANTLKYSETTPYYTDAACTNLAETEALGAPTVTPSVYRYYTLNSRGQYRLELTSSAKDVTYKYPAVMSYYEMEFHKVDATDVTNGTYASSQAYKKSTDDALAAGDLFTPISDVPAVGDWVIKNNKGKKVPFYAGGKTYYKRDANYFMVVPTNNIQNISTAITSAADLEALRTVRVKIKYYITTEDGNLSAGRAQTENVIEKNVVFPSLANGKSYNLNLILGLTSVKMEAEVDDWKVINVNADLPQNTAE